MTTMASRSKKRDWMSLPYDILTSTLPYLVTSEDYIRFSLVCKQWHSVAKAERHNHMATRKQIPFLLLPTKEDMWSLYSVAQGRLLHSKLQVPYKRWICGSSHGWLIFSGYDDDDIIITLFNPFTQAQISLPRITYHKQRPLFVKKVVLSVDPSIRPNDFIVAACIFAESHYILALIRPGISHEWRTLTHSDWLAAEYCSQMTCDLMFDRSGKWVYAAMHNGLVVRADLDERGVLERVVQPWWHRGNRYLGESSSSGDLLIFSGLNDHKVKVWKLQGSRFVEVHDLVGDTAAFIGEYSSTTVVGRGFQGAETNSVYFYRSSSSYILRKFNLKDGEFDLGRSLRNDLPSGCYGSAFHPVWILPSVNL